MTFANAKVAGILIGVFALGAVAGAAGSFAYTRDELQTLADQPGMREQVRIRALSRRLGLSGDQERELERVMSRHRKDRKAVWMKAMEQCGAPIRKQKAELDGEIRGVLNDEQRAKFDHFVEEHRPLGPQSQD